MKLRLPEDTDPRAVSGILDNAYVNVDAELRVRASESPAETLAARVGEAIEKARRAAGERESMAEECQLRLAELVDSVRSGIGLGGGDPGRTAAPVAQSVPRTRSSAAPSR